MKGMILAVALAGALMLAGCGGKTASMTPTPAPTPTVLSALPEGHSLESGTIPVGRSQTIYDSGGVRVVATCTGADCAIEVSDSGVATVTGGRVTISVTGPTSTTETPTPGTPTGTEFETPTTPPALVIENPLIDWEELPTLVGHMNHRTQLRASDLPGPSCDGGVVDCQAAVKELLANASPFTSHVILEKVNSEDGNTRIYQEETGGWFEGIKPGSRVGTVPGPNYWGGWLDNSIFIVENTVRPDAGPSLTAGFFANKNTWPRLISMGIRDTNPVVGVYRGRAVMPGSLGSFELTYTRGAAGGQLDLEITFIYVGWPRTWSNIPVDNEGAFDNGIQAIDNVSGPGKLEGRFYQGGEVGGVFIYKDDVWPTQHFGGAFGGKLVPDGP